MLEKICGKIDVGCRMSLITGSGRVGAASSGSGCFAHPLHPVVRPISASRLSPKSTLNMTFKLHVAVSLGFDCLQLEDGRLTN